MYAVIERGYDLILKAITQDDVKNYDWLIENRDQCGGPKYQRRYRSFWGMNAARLGSAFYSEYFAALQPSLENPMSLEDLCQRLYNVSARQDGRHTLQFSFATKLMHTLSPKLPIYDSRVARFFLYREPSSDLMIEERIIKMSEYYGFLAREYERIVKEHRLDGAIAAFRKQFAPRHHTDEKIIDWLIWAFIGVAADGALMRGDFVFE